MVENEGVKNIGGRPNIPLLNSSTRMLFLVLIAGGNTTQKQIDRLVYAPDKTWTAFKGDFRKAGIICDKKSSRNFPFEEDGFYHLFMDHVKDRFYSYNIDFYLQDLQNKEFNTGFCDIAKLGFNYLQENSTIKFRKAVSLLIKETLRISYDHILQKAYGELNFQAFSKKIFYTRNELINQLNQVKNKSSKRPKKTPDKFGTRIELEKEFTPLDLTEMKRPNICGLNFNLTSYFDEIIDSSIDYSGDIKFPNVAFLDKETNECFLHLTNIFYAITLLKVYNDPRTLRRNEAIKNFKQILRRKEILEKI